MYEFLLSEAWWTDTLTVATITALITATATIIAAALTYNYSIKKILDTVISTDSKVDKSKNGLSSEHHGLSKEHHDIHASVMAARHEAQTTSTTINKIHENIIEDKVKQKMQYNNLTEKQKDISHLVTNSVDAIKSMHSELQHLNSENQSLKHHNTQLEAQNTSLSAQVSKLEERNTLLTQQYESVLREINSPTQTQPKNPKPTYRLDR